MSVYRNYNERYVKVLDTTSDEISIIKLDDYVKMIAENPYNEDFFTILYKCDKDGNEIRSKKNE